MTPKTLSYSVLGDMKQVLGQMRSAIFIIFLGYMGVGPAFAFLSALNLKSYFDTHAEGALIEMVHFFLGDVYLPIYIVGLIFAFVAGLAITRYQNVATQSNFYHSLAATRSQLLMARILAFVLCEVVLSALAVIFINGSVLYSAGVISDLNSYLPLIFKGAVVHFMQINLIFLLSLAITLFAGQLTANTVAQGLMVGVLHTFIPAGGLCLMGLVSVTTKTYMSGSIGLVDKMVFFNIFYDWGSKLPNLRYKAQADVDALRVADVTMSMHVLVIMLALTVVLFALTFILYRRRPSEKAGDTLVYRTIGTLIKIYVIVVGSVILGLLFYEMSGKSSVSFIVGSIIAMLFIHTLAEMIYNQDTHAFKKHLLSGLIGGALAIACFYIPNNNVINFDAKVPQASEIKAVAIMSTNDYMNVDNYLKTDAAHDSEYIRDVADVLQMISKTDKSGEFSDEVKALEFNPVDGEKSEENVLALAKYTPVNIIYETRLGRTSRQFYLKGKDVAILGKVLENSHYQTMIMKPFLDKELDQYGSLFIEDELIASLADDRNAGSYLGGAKGIRRPEDKERLKQLIEALKKDVDKRKADTYRGRILYKIDNNREYYQDNYDFSFLPIYVYETDTNTVALFKQWQEQGFMPKHDETLMASIKNNVKLPAEIIQLDYDNQTYKVVKTIDDPQALLNLINTQAFSTHVDTIWLSSSDDYILRLTVAIPQTDEDDSNSKDSYRATFRLSKQFNPEMLNQASTTQA